MHENLIAIAAACYLGAALLLYFSFLKSEQKLRRYAALVTGVGMVLHSAGQYRHWFVPGTVEINSLNVLSLCALAVVGILMFSKLLRKSLFDAGLVALPIAAFVLFLEWLLVLPGTELQPRSFEITIHIISSISAFGVLSVAGVYAVFIALIDHFLRKHRLTKLIRTLPALETLESLLFQLITAGFIILTISLGTGLLFVNDLFAQHLAHKTILSIIAWLVFGTLMWGRRFRGWRGRVAVRMTLAGVLILLLSYFGSKLVLEVILERSWQT
jgi:ABC-type uncharacterized transport system permease subunit